MNNNKKNFLELIEEQHKIRIPKIQRDYAQGRKSKKVEEIRTLFVHALMRVVKGQVEEQELDFVYGSLAGKDAGVDQRAFEPLDGQQRLTTLFLLHWMLGCDKLSTDGKHSVLTYETRSSSKEFCDELVVHKAQTYIDECKFIEDEKKRLPSEIIKKRDWYKWEWKFDPTVQSMLEVIDTIYKEMEGIADTEQCLNRLSNIRFNFLDLKDFNASDELFVKMNARGKQLSDFDIMKSTLEEELQIQKVEKKSDCNNYYVTDADEEEWRTYMDGKWIDMFWNKYARKAIEKGDEKKHAAIETEVRFRRLLLRLIALQLFSNDNVPQKVKEACYHVDEKELGKLIYTYQDYIMPIRHKQGESLVDANATRIDFRILIDDINRLIYNTGNADNPDYHETTELLGSNFKVDIDTPVGNTVATLFDVFLKEDRLGNDIEIIFYSVLLYLRIVGCEDCTSSLAWRENFREWTSIMRNVFLNANLDQRIDKIGLMENSIKGVERFANRFRNFLRDNSLDINSQRDVVRQFIADIGQVKRNEFPGIDNQGLQEEIDKAKLKIEDGRWIEAIDRAEAHNYLWGQIRCLINWSHGDIEVFNDYTNRLHHILNFTVEEENRLSFYSVLLCIVPDTWKNHKNRLFEFNKSRDNSIKRCLRDIGANDEYFGQPMKMVIDKWIKEYHEMDVAEFFSSVIRDGMYASPAWIKCILENHDILNYSWRKKIFEKNGHVILAKLQTTDSHCIDPILKFIQIQTNRKCQFGDSKSEKPHSVEYVADGKTHTIKWAENESGLYSLKVDDEPEQTKSAAQIVELALMINKE